jgi:outer membrane biosynthesis protein TonB
VALSDDQKAILRLLAQRGEQGYEDLSALMGVSAAEVHRRAKEAAAALEAEGIPAPAIPEPPGVGGGGGDPPSVAKDGEAPPGESPPPSAPVEAPEPQGPQEPSPEVAKSTEAPREKPKPAPKPPASKPTGERKHRTFKEDVRRLMVLENRGLWALLAGVAVVVLFVVFIFAGAGDDSEDSGGGGSASADSCRTTAKAPAPTGRNLEQLAVATVKGGKEATRAVLDPVDGSEARGLAVFGRVKDSLALQIVAEGLPPSGECGYTIWLAASPEKMLPLASTQVGKNGVLGAQVEVPVEILGYLANETFGQIAITRTDESQLKASLAKATDEKEAPQYTGTEVLRGSVAGPIVGAAKRLEEEGK